MIDEINIMVGGEAGQGVQSVGLWLAKSFTRGGYYVFADQDYESRIRGGHNFFRVRISCRRIAAFSEHIDILIALNAETINLHREEVTENGVIIYDDQITGNIPEDKHLFGMPLQTLAEQQGGNKVMANTVALGAALGLLHYDIGIAGKILLEQFGDVSNGQGNIRAAAAGYEYSQLNYHGDFAEKLKPAGGIQRMLLNGTEAIALGALAAGCKFIASYPMTPSTPILEYLAAKARECDIAVIQPEDEIAAVNMAIGASFAGVRAMTATSGSGFCLMVEGLGLSGITETPLVIVDGQRPGPAVGLPTRTEQGDLQFVLNAHQGDFPRVVLAPSSVEDAFYITVKAFNLAEKYQLPVIILNDHYQATAYASVDRFDLKKVNIERGDMYSPDKTASTEYKRHQITPSGISPRAFPGLSRALVVTDSDEHDETGHLIEDAHMRSEQMQKRLRKLVPLKQEMTVPEIYGAKKATISVIGWGITCGALREAVDILRREDKMSINLLHLNELWPFPAEKVTDVLKKAKQSYVVENNAGGQLARLIRQETGQQVTGTILKFDGRPFSPAVIAQKLREECD